MSMSFEERIVWITLVSMLVTFSVYFVIATRMIAAGVTVVAAFAPLFIVVLIAMVVIVGAAAAVAALVSRPEGRDERDRLIEWRAEHNSGWVLGAGVIIAIGGLAITVENVWIAHLLLLSMFLSQVLKHAVQLYHYRRGV